MDDRNPNLPPRPWYRRYLVTAGLLLLVAAMGVTGGMTVQVMLSTSISRCAEDTKDALGRIETNPAGASEEIEHLREVFEDCPGIFTAASYFLAHPAPGGHELEWIALVCYLHDRGDARATARLDELQVRTGDGETTLLEWLKTRADDKLEPAFREHMDELEFRAPPRHIDVTGTGE